MNEETRFKVGDKVCISTIYNNDKLDEPTTAEITKVYPQTKRYRTSYDERIKDESEVYANKKEMFESFIKYNEGRIIKAEIDIKIYKEYIENIQKVLKQIK
jgi:hypothetical protein